MFSYFVPVLRLGFGTAPVGSARCRDSIRCARSTQGSGSVASGASGDVERERQAVVCCLQRCRSGKECHLGGFGASNVRVHTSSHCDMIFMDHAYGTLKWESHIACFPILCHRFDPARELGGVNLRQQETVCQTIGRGPKTFRTTSPDLELSRRRPFYTTICLLNQAK